VTLVHPIAITWATDAMLKLLKISIMKTPALPVSLNVVTEKNKIRAMILDAKRREKFLSVGTSVGDRFLNGELDLEYVANVTWAC